LFTQIRRSTHSLLLSTAAFGLLASASGAAAQGVPILQPGAPGKAPKVLSAREAVRVAETRYSADDVRYMQGMIHHHQQAVEMAALVKGRTSRQELIDVADRIAASQADEMKFMQTWLRERGETAPNPARVDGAHGAHGAHSTMAAMEGMATPAQMAALAAATGPEFERLFLERMIAHHDGAITMTEKLLKQPGSAYDPVLEAFTTDVSTEQKAEINRMTAVLLRLLPDPRTKLTSGFRDAGQAASNITLLASLPKPTGFFDPANPAGLPPIKPPKAAKAGAAPAKQGAEAMAPAAEAKGDPDFGKRSPLLSFANTDMAFSKDLLAVGNYHGFNMYRLTKGAPVLLSSVVCPGGQGDVSIVGDLLIMSVEQTRGRIDCGRQGVSEDVSAERFRGLRIFNIADPRRPRQVGQVQTCRGSHTHSVVSDPQARDSVIVYVSGTSSIRKAEELAGCVGDAPGDERTALFRIDVVEIPIANPARARIIDSPAVFADAASGRLSGLWQGGDHGDDTQETRRTDQCHDITVFPSRKLAAGACSGNGIIFDISDPRKPRRIDAVADPSFAYWHSATFNNDGTKVLFTDEWGGGSRPRCRTQDRRNWGANAIYDIVGSKLQFRSYYKLPAVQTERENCVAHNGSVVPVPGRDIFVQAWYQGGLSVSDFTDSARPVEIAFFDRGPIDEKHEVLGGFWSTYWYNGRIYGTEIARGLDVLELKPSQHLTANEIAAARLADQGSLFNPQQQYPVTWPAHPVVALAYVDQLARAQALSPAALADLRTALGQARTLVDGKKRDRALAGRVEALAAGLQAGGNDPASQRRAAALRETLTGVAAKLR
jgi:uncharacterized protein (DUF305 family)